MHTHLMRTRVAFALAALVTACGDEETTSTTGATEAATLADGGTHASSVPTWYHDIQPIVHLKCGACHRPDAIAPFSVQDYASAKGFASLMADSVEAGRMPPFGARESADCTPRHKFADDPRLTAEEKKLLRAWAEGGAPAGDKASAAPLEEPASVTIERADVVMKLPEPILVEETGKGDLHTCIIVDPKIEKDGYVVSRQVTSGNEKVLHHVTTYVVSPALADGTPITREEMNAAFQKAKGAKVGEHYDCFGGPTLDSTGLSYALLGSWAPGAKPVTSPPDSGQPVKAGSVVVLDMHYHPLASGPETDDSTEYTLQFADSVPRYVASPIFMGFADAKQPVFDDSPMGVQQLLKQPGETEPAMVIPAGASDHVEEWTFKWKLPQTPLKIYFASSHMHYAGRNLRVTLEHADDQGKEGALECLEETPAWDFNWQLGYSWDVDYDGLPTIHDGDTIHVRCTFDNTRDNPAIAKALDAAGHKDPVDINVGEDTLDEMCLSLMGISYPNIAYFQASGVAP
jgi:hypothetical protein